MKRPTWATIVGVLAIIFGIFGVFGGAQEMAMPSILEMQKEMMENFSQGKTPDGETAPKVTMEVETEGETKKVEIAQMFESMEEQFKFPEWYKTWAVVIGIVSMIVSALYLLSGVFLLMKKQFAIKVFYIAITASTIWAVLQAVVYAQTGSGMLMAQIPMSIASVVIDIVLVIIVLIGNKEAFTEHVAEI